MIVRVLPRDLTLAQSMALDVMDRACFPNDAIYPKHVTGSRWWIAYDRGANNLIACGLRLWTPAPGYAWAGRDVLYWRKDPE